MPSPYDLNKDARKVLNFRHERTAIRAQSGGLAACDRLVSHNGGVTVPAPTELDQPDTDFIVELEDPWVTVVWNDPVNLMSYVAFVFRTYFGYTEEKANELMMTVHNQGRANVSAGRREEQERHVQAMHEYGLWATLERGEV